MSGTVRTIVVSLVVGACAVGGCLIYEKPIRAVARDYLAHRRVIEHADILRAAAAESGVESYLLAAIMVAESSGRVGAVSHKNALGLFQLSMGTALWRAELMGLAEPTREQLLSDPWLNARLGADTMAWLLRTYDGNELRALCAYNAGTGRMKQLATEAGGWEAWVERGERSGRSEILAYGKKVLRYRSQLRDERILE